MCLRARRPGRPGIQCSSAANQNAGAGQQGTQGGNQPATSTAPSGGANTMQQQPANQSVGAGQQGQVTNQETSPHRRPGRADRQVSRHPTIRTARKVSLRPDRKAAIRIAAAVSKCAPRSNNRYLILPRLGGAFFFVSFLVARFNQFEKILVRFRRPQKSLAPKAGADLRFYEASGM